MNSKPKLKAFLERWHVGYHGVSVEWIDGIAPTAVFLNENDEVIRSEALDDWTSDEMTGFLYARGFQMDNRYEFPSSTPDKVGKFGDSTYEYFQWPNPKEFAQEFAEKKGGNMLVLESKEEAAYIALDFFEGKHSDVWLAAEQAKGDEEGHWEWVAGEAKETFWTNGTAVDGAYVEWLSETPGPAKCAALVVEKTEDKSEEDKSEEDDSELAEDASPVYGLIDIPCRASSNIIIEYKGRKHEEL